MSIWGAFDFLTKGGWVAWVLAGFSIVLWYAIGYRFLFLRSKYLQRQPESLLKENQLQVTDLLGDVVLAVKKHKQHNVLNIELALQHEMQSFIEKLKTHKQTIKSIVMVAPLLGLLGTVIGMIETFDSLQDSALFSQSGGIAGGISQALITTQMGLVVAVPGLLIGKKLENREKELVTYVERLFGFVQLQGEKS